MRAIRLIQEKIRMSLDKRTAFSKLRQSSDWKFLLGRPSLQHFNCKLPDYGRHVTGPNKGLSSLAPGGVKMRDPGNEVVILLAIYFQTFKKLLESLRDAGDLYNFENTS